MAFMNFGKRTILAGDIRLNRGVDVLRDPLVGSTYFVDALLGSDSNTGKTWAASFLTRSKAFTTVASGDRIYFTGKVREQLSTPVQVFDVQVIGTGNRPRHSDATPVGGDTAMATWAPPASPTATTALVKVLQQGWSFENILFQAHTDYCAIDFFRDNGTGNAERDASHGIVRGCRFSAGQDGVYITEVSDMLIEGNQFEGLTGYAIKGIANDGIANPLRGIVRNNYFRGNTNHFYVTCNAWAIHDNFFDDGETPNTTVVCDVVGSGGGAKDNYVVNNWFQTATANFNAPDVKGTTTDVWFNVSIDSFTAGLESGHEAGQPA